MPIYRVFRMKDSPRQQFRWAPHVSGLRAQAEGLRAAGEVEALHEYDAWRLLREAARRWRWAICWRPTDGQLRICKYVGFEPAQWVLPEAEAPAIPSRRMPSRNRPASPPPLGDRHDARHPSGRRYRRFLRTLQARDEPQCGVGAERRAAKVRCRTCHSDHDFRHEQAPPPKVDARKAALFNEVLKKVDPSDAKAVDDLEPGEVAELDEAAEPDEVVEIAESADEEPPTPAPVPKAKAKGRGRK